jgi:histidinol dehydrogenase
LDGGYRALMPRPEFNVENALETVRPLVADVADRGVEALKHYTQLFDHVQIDNFRVPKQAMEDALANLDPELRAAFETAIARRRLVAEAELGESEVDTVLGEGATVTTRTVPLSRVGVYVPGGLAPLASSVLMNVIPAQAAGVGEIALASPPGPDGLPNSGTLAMCALLGIDEVYAVGGAQAIAMFAYGAEGLCEAVDLISGPGNIYVVAAKRLVRPVVGIDSEAGPTEIMVIADADANPAFVAADLISQAEHDPMAGSVLVTDSAAFLAEVEKELEAQVAATKHNARVTQALSGQQSAAILVRSLGQAVQVADAYGAEHLEIQTADARVLASQIHNAGAIFVGPYSPVPLGDYTAGSTHVLPTLGTARYSSGLTARSFVKTVHVIEYTETGLGEVAGVIEAFGAAEDLPAHAFAATVRRRDV